MIGYILGGQPVGVELVFSPLSPPNAAAMFR
jgi:hypothetical protein